MTLTDTDELEELYGRDIATFNAAMLFKLRMYMHRGHWSEASPVDLLNKLHDELEELTAAMGDEGAKASKEEIMLECADIANYAMMIATNVGRKND